MHHFFDAITNTSGDSLIGYFARVVNRSTQATVTIYADESGTPIQTVSGYANLAKTDDYGNLSLYVEPGTYHLDIYAADAETFRFRVPDVGMQSEQGVKGDKGDKGDPGPAGNVAETLAQLKAASTFNVAMIYDGSVFNWTLGDFTGQADDLNIVQGDGVPLTTGAWVRSRELVSVTDYDVDPADATPAFTAAQAAADFVFVPAGTYILDSFALASGKTFFGNNVEIIPIDGSTPAITATNVDNWSLLGNWRITGTFVPDSSGYPTTEDLYVTVAARPSSGTAIGIQIQVCRDWLIENLTIIGLNGTGVKFTGGLNHYPRTYGKLVNPNISWCVTGIETVADDTAAEYLTIDNPILAQNKKGIVVAIGNIEVNGGQIVDNQIGVELVGESSPGVPANNHGHGIFNGVQINHNFERNISASDIINGHTFDSCHFYGDPPSVGYPLGQGLIVLDNCKGIFFRGGIMSSPLYWFGPACQNGVTDTWLPHPATVGPFFEPNADGIAARAQAVFKGNTTDSGSWGENQVTDITIQAERITSTQSLTVGTGQDIIFNDVVLSQRGTWTDDDFDTATGRATASVSGWYEIEVMVELDVTTFVGGYAFVLLNGTGYRVAPIGLCESGIAIAGFRTRRKLTAGSNVGVSLIVNAATAAVRVGSTFQMILVS
jgi:hypothetical protein